MSKKLNPASKLYYFAVQDDPKSKNMDVKVFMKDGKIGFINRKFEAMLQKLKTQWQFAIISYGVTTEGKEYRDVQFAQLRQPVNSGSVDMGKIVENIIHLTSSPEERSEIFARAYILSPKNKNMDLLELMRARKEQLSFSDAELEEIQDIKEEDMVLLEMPL